MGTDATVSIALIVAVIGAVATVYNLSASRKKNVQADDAKLNDINTGLLKVNMKLDTVCSTTNDIKTDVKAVQMQSQQMQTDVAVVQRDLKTAFTRIDELKARIDGKA